MYKFLTTTALVSLSNAAFTSEFMQGAQTAIFLANESDFADYSCPEPEMDEDIERYINMIEPMKNMFAPQKPRKHKKGQSADDEPEEEEQGIIGIINKMTKYADQIGVVMSVMSPGYEGGDFCQGLTAAFEMKTLVVELAGTVMQGLFTPNHGQDLDLNLKLN